VATNGALSGTPLLANVGTNTFVIGVTDTNGFYASTNLSIVVIADPAPTFSSSTYTEPSANAGAAYTGSIATNATALYAALGDVVTYSLVSGPAWLSVSSGGALSGTPADSDGGTNVVLVSATDLGGSSNTATVYIYVNSHPVFTTTNLASAIVGFAYSGALSNDVVDAPLAVGDTLSFTEISSSDWLTVGPDGTLSGTPGAGDVGTNLVTVEAIDSDGLTATATLAIIVSPDLPPSFVYNPFTAPSATAGQPYATTLATNTVEAIPDDTLTFASISGPAWLTVATNGVISGTPALADAGTEMFVVSATDLAGVSNTLTVYITVNVPPGPVITVPSDITVQATNLAGDVVFFTVTATDSVYGVLSPVVTPASGSTFPLGTNVVTATATNSLGQSATNTFDVIVVDTNLPVIVTEPVSLTNYAGTSASFTVSATAFSPLSYQWSLGTNALAGATNSTLSIASVGPTNVGCYSVVVTSDGGSVTSTPAMLTVLYVAPTVVSSQSSLGAGGFQLSFYGPLGQTYQVLASATVAGPYSGWTVLGTGTFGSTNAVFTDTNAVNNPYQFYIITSP
jgi:hypothetical protein